MSNNKRKCNRERARQYRAKNPEKYKEYQTNYRNKNRAKINSIAQKYYRNHINENRKRKKEYMRKRRLLCPKLIAKQKFEWRQKRREKFIELLGGKCQRCGYNKYSGALDFHHINPDDKRKGESEYMWKYFEDLIKNGKIMLLCANCHREESWKNINNQEEHKEND